MPSQKSPHKYIGGKKQKSSIKKNSGKYVFFF